MYHRKVLCDCAYQWLHFLFYSLWGYSSVLILVVIDVTMYFIHSWIPAPKGGHLLYF